MTAFIKGRVCGLCCAWWSWQWVTPFKRGFALCSIISHYYMSHLPPRIPEGVTHTLLLTHIRTQMIPTLPCTAPITPKTIAPWHPAKWVSFHYNLHSPPQWGSYSKEREREKKRKSPERHWRNSMPHSRAKKFGSLGKHSSSFVKLQNGGTGANAP